MRTPAKASTEVRRRPRRRRTGLASRQLPRRLNRRATNRRRNRRGQPATEARREGWMRKLRKLLIFPAVLMLIAVGCTSEDDGGDGGDNGGAANQEENTGTVNVLNAMEPEEADAVQALWESTYPDLDYTVDFEAS